jgi:hypothetical protein
VTAQCTSRPSVAKYQKNWREIRERERERWKRHCGEVFSPTLYLVSKLFPLLPDFVTVTCRGKRWKAIERERRRGREMGVRGFKGTHTPPNTHALPHNQRRDVERER